MHIVKLATLACALAASPCHDGKQPAASEYMVQLRFVAPGEARWDLLAVDPSQYRLFVSRTDRVQVIDTRDGHLVKTLLGTRGVHGIAVVTSLKRVFTANGDTSSVSEFDGVTLAPLRELPLRGKGADALQFDKSTGRLLVFNAISNDVSVIDTDSGREVATIPFEGNPELPAGDGKGRVFVNIEDRAELVEIDVRKALIKNTWQLPGCVGPTGLAFDRSNDIAFSACQNGVAVVTDVSTGGHVASLPIGQGPDGAAFDRDTGMLFIPNGRSGTLSVIHEDDPTHFRLLQTLTTQVGARTLALDARSGRVYLPAATYSADSEGRRRSITPGSARILVIGVRDTSADHVVRPTVESRGSGTQK